MYWTCGVQYLQQGKEPLLYILLLNESILLYVCYLVSFRWYYKWLLEFNHTYIFKSLHLCGLFLERVIAWQAWHVTLYISVTKSEKKTRYLVTVHLNDAEPHIWLNASHMCSLESLTPKAESHLHQKLRVTYTKNLVTYTKNLVTYTKNLKSLILKTYSFIPKT